MLLLSGRGDKDMDTVARGAWSGDLAADRHSEAMVRKVAGHDRNSASGGQRKKLHSKSLKLKKLHRDVASDRDELKDLPPDQLPAASSSNAARQARSRLNNTFPVDWQSLHTKKSSENGDEAVGDSENQDKTN